jgi:uncharacterized protein (DUF169 family)
MRELRTDLSILNKLEFQHAPVGIKFLFKRPERMERIDKPAPLCGMVREAQKRGTPFYFAKEDEDCFGTIALGMEEAPVFAEAGLMGEKFEVFQEPRANLRIYQHVRTLPKGTVNYAALSAINALTFEPDLLIILATPSQAEIVLRALSYSTGELWETRTTPVLSCAWLYSYPFMTGKVNYMVTGMAFGSKAKRIYPEGMLLISIPWDKMPVILENLKEMTWILPAYTEGPDKFLEREQRVREESFQESLNP